MQHPARTSHFSLALLVLLLAVPTLLAADITLDPASTGRTFDGIGAVSAGANSRLLIDYDEPVRSDVLDFLFKPYFGAAFHHLKVELGGGTNSTSGAEPSHAISPDEIANPVSRGYEFWLMQQARLRNPDINLDFLPWTFPYWLGTPFTNKQAYADYFTSFMTHARDEFGLTVDWVSAAKNESYTDLDWIKNYLRPTMDAAGFAATRIQAPDGHGNQAWAMFDDIVYNPLYNPLIDAIGYHYIDQGGDPRYPTQAMIDTGKTMWDSEDSVSSGAWTNGREIVRRMNSLYTKGRITQMQIWCPIDSADAGAFLSNVGVMKADTPWSGHYTVRPAVWCVAHYTQFTQPGWRFLDDACGPLSGNGNYATLISPDSNHWSMIVYAENAETLNISLAAPLANSTVHVWKSTESDQFIQLPDITPSAGQFTLSCSPESLYSLTTTTGQQKGAPALPIPAAADFPFPFAENFESYPVGATPKWFSDMQGTFEVAPCAAGRSGQCLQQILPQIGNPWAFDWVNPHAPMTIFGDMAWQNYEANMDFYIDSGEIYLAVRKDATQKRCGYALVVDKAGNWRLSLDNITDPDATLASGAIASFDSNAWHNLKVRAVHDQIDAFLDGIRICSLADPSRAAGQPCIGGSFDLNQYDNIAVYPTGPDQTPWTTLDDTHPSLSWIQWWGAWSQADYYNGTCKFSENIGSAVSFPFYGRFARVIGAKRPDLGYLSISLDNAPQAPVDCYAENTAYQALLYETPELPLGNHTLRLEVSGDKNPASTGHEIVLDAFAFSQTGNSWCPIAPLDDPEPPVNLALTATPSSSSDWNASYAADKANDGDWNTRWNSAPGDENGCWLAITFPAPRTFNQARFKQLYDRIQSYKIQYYHAGQWNDAFTAGQMSEFPQTVIFPPVTASAARILVTETTTVPSIHEFQLYNAPASSFLPTYVDLNNDGLLDLKDLAALCAQWLHEDCDTSCPCDKADIYHDGLIDLRDFALLQSRLAYP